MNKKFIDKIKYYGIGEYIFKDGQFGLSGPGSKNVGYVLSEEVNNNSMEGRSYIFYRVWFYEFNGYYIAIPGSGTFYPYQNTLFTL